MEVEGSLPIRSGKTFSTGKGAHQNLRAQYPLLLQSLPTHPHPNTQSSSPSAFTVDTLRDWELSLRCESG